MKPDPALERFVQRLVTGGSMLGTAFLVFLLMLPLLLPPAIAIALLIWLL